MQDLGNISKQLSTHGKKLVAEKINIYTENVSMEDTVNNSPLQTHNVA
jgi:hypothetical protein